MANKKLWTTATAVLAAVAVYFIMIKPGRTPQQVDAPPDETPVEKILRETEKVVEIPEEPTVLESIVNIVNPPEEIQPIPDVVQTGTVYKLNSNMTLATVNGVPITMRDLMPVNPGKYTENNMGPEMYATLVTRAINRELANQEAKRKGIKLNEEQLQNLEKIRQRALEKDPNSFTDIHDDFNAKAEFEVRDFAGLMLQESLLAESGGPPKYVSPEMVEAYMCENKEKLGGIPEDETARTEMEISIRTELSAKVDHEYQAQLQVMLDGLKQQAKIQEFVTVENN